MRCQWNNSVHNSSFLNSEHQLSWCCQTNQSQWRTFTSQRMYRCFHQWTCDAEGERQQVLIKACVNICFTVYHHRCPWERCSSWFRIFLSCMFSFRKILGHNFVIVKSHIPVRSLSRFGPPVHILNRYVGLLTSICAASLWLDPRVTLTTS